MRKELEYESSCLRRLVTALLLENVKLEGLSGRTEFVTEVAGLIHRGREGFSGGGVSEHGQ